jgi:hypothetical protein
MSTDGVRRARRIWAMLKLERWVDTRHRVEGAYFVYVYYCGFILPSIHPPFVIS